MSLSVNISLRFLAILVALATLAAVAIGCSGGTTGSPTAGGASAPEGEPAVADSPEGLARRVIPLMRDHDWGAFLELVRPDHRDYFQRIIDRGSMDDVSGCLLGTEQYLVEEESLGEVNVAVLFNTECVNVMYEGFWHPKNQVRISFERVSGRWWLSRGF